MQFQHWRIRGSGLRCFRSLHSFLACVELNRPCCVISDATIHGVPAADMQREIRQKFGNLPHILFCQRYFHRGRSRHMEQGAITIQKRNENESKLVEYVLKSLDIDAKHLQIESIYQRIRKILLALTDRQSECLKTSSKERLPKESLIRWAYHSD